jgi:hypothetical protein
LVASKLQDLRHHHLLGELVRLLVGVADADTRADPRAFSPG